MRLGRSDVTFLIDTQLEAHGVHPLLRLDDEDGRTFCVDLEWTNRDIQVNLLLALGEEWFFGRTPLSATTGKRLAVRYLPTQQTVMVDEIQPWGPQPKAIVDLARSDHGPKRNWRGFRVGGAGEGASCYRGRVGEVAIFAKALTDGRVEEIRSASRPANADDVPRFDQAALDEEGLELFLEDYKQLVRWHNSAALAKRELREASTLAHLWILDRYPLLQRVSNHFGAMLSFPDLRRSEALAARIDEEKPALWWPQNEHDGDWVSLSTFRDDLACWLGDIGQAVTWAAFVRFVRNKLGGGHFDPDDRTRWQRELNELARQTKVAGEPWLFLAMRTLVRSLIMAADGSGLSALARDHFSREL